ncbi:MAG: galactosyldiacylglycerol synthase [Spartobacteria bacterium]
MTASFGEGHNAAARGIRDGLVRVSADTEVEVHDLFAEVYGALNKIVGKAYIGLINRWPRSWGSVYRWLDRQQNFDRGFLWLHPVKNRLARLLVRFDPDVIVSVFPAYPYLLKAILGSQPRYQNVVVVTDSITVNAIWYRARADYILVPNEQSAAVVRATGVDPELIRTIGFPVNPVFADLPQDRQSPAAGNRRVLYMIHAGTLSAPETVRRLLALDIHLTVTVGRDEKLRQTIAAIPRSQDKIDIVGWTSELPRLLSANHLLIGKAGGAMVQETIAARCPMIINHIVSGQEEGNAQLILETNSGGVAKSPEEVARAVENAFADDAKQWREWTKNISALSKPRASLDIAKFLLSI